MVQFQFSFAAACTCFNSLFGDADGKICIFCAEADKLDDVCPSTISHTHSLSQGLFFLPHLSIWGQQKSLYDRDDIYDTLCGYLCGAYDRPLLPLGWYIEHTHSLCQLSYTERKDQVVIQLIKEAGAPKAPYTLKEISILTEVHLKLLVKSHVTSAKATKVAPWVLFSSCTTQEEPLKAP